MIGLLLRYDTLVAVLTESMSEWLLGAAKHGVGLLPVLFVLLEGPLLSLR